MKSPQISTMEMVSRYVVAKRIVVDAGYEAEIAWQMTRRTGQVTSRTFLREASWVILCAGMRESVIRQKFPLVRRALHQFQPGAIVRDPRARAETLRVFRHERKVDAILRIAKVACDLRTSGIRRALSADPMALLNALPYMGPATGRHLAKNLGVSVAKPDRHLARLAFATGRGDAEKLCIEVAQWLGDPVPVVDVVLWRWSTLHQRNCSEQLCDGLPHV